jgi:hypothetical protein
MKLTIGAFLSVIITFAPAALALATPPELLAAPFAINIGQSKSTGNDVAWVAGQSQCNNAILGPVGGFARIL